MIGKTTVVAVTLLAGVLALTSAAQAQSAAPKVFRGTVATDAKAQTGHRSVAVVRGGGVMPTGLAAPVKTGDGLQVVGGERIWFVDFANETLTNCNLENTIYVGRRVVRCRTRSLPNGSLY